MLRNSYKLSILKLDNDTRETMISKQLSFLAFLALIVCPSWAFHQNHTAVDASTYKNRGCPSLYDLTVFWGNIGFIPWLSIKFSKSFSSDDSSICYYKAENNTTYKSVDGNSNGPLFFGIIITLGLYAGISALIWHKVKKSIETMNFKYVSAGKSIKIRDLEPLLLKVSSKTSLRTSPEKSLVLPSPKTVPSVTKIDNEISRKSSSITQSVR